MPNNTPQDYDGHHKVSSDRAYELWVDDVFGRGDGDPDYHGNPDEKITIEQDTATYESLRASF